LVAHTLSPRRRAAGTDYGQSSIGQATTIIPNVMATIISRLPHPKTHARADQAVVGASYRAAGNHGDGTEPDRRGEEQQTYRGMSAVFGDGQGQDRRCQNARRHGDEKGDAVHLFENDMARRRSYWLDREPCRHRPSRPPGPAGGQQVALSRWPFHVGKRQPDFFDLRDDHVKAERRARTTPWLSSCCGQRRPRNDQGAAFEFGKVLGKLVTRCT